MAFRALLKTPLNAALAVMALGLGIGLTATTWSVPTPWPCAVCRSTTANS